MPEFVIFLTPADAAARRPLQAVREHCAHLGSLDAQCRLVAAGPFGDAEGGGMIIGSFASLEEAETSRAGKAFTSRRGRSASAASVQR